MRIKRRARQRSVTVYCPILTIVRNYIARSLSHLRSPSIQDTRPHHSHYTHTQPSETIFIPVRVGDSFASPLPRVHAHLLTCHSRLFTRPSLNTPAFSPLLCFFSASLYAMSFPLVRFLAGCQANVR